MNHSHLVKSPDLPSTQLAPYCYQGMFLSCSALTTAPQLNATTLKKGCYKSMFEGCSSLSSGPVLPATTLTTECYQNMFLACSNLSYLEVKFTSWDNFTDDQNRGETYWWLSFTKYVGTFKCPSALAQKRAYSTYTCSYIPPSWSIVTY